MSQMSWNMGGVTVNAIGPQSIGMQTNYHGVPAPPAPRNEHTARIAIESYVEEVQSDSLAIPPSANDLYDQHCKQDEFIYKIAHTPKGYVLLISVYFDDGQGESPGAGKDVESMKALWEGLGFKVLLKSTRDETTFLEIQKTLARFATDHKFMGADVIAIFVMSHGMKDKNGNEVFFTSDRKVVKSEDLITRFDNANATMYQGKPKLFFFQFCRGPDSDKGVEKLEQQLDDVSLGPPGEKTDLPTRSDMMIAHASLSGFKCYRSPTHGGWFINAIANVFSKHAKNEDILRLMTKVNHAVSLKIAKSTTKPEENGCKQMSETRFSLTKELYLFPGFPEEATL